MSSTLIRFAFVSLALAGCTPPGDVDSSGDELLCRTCGGDGDPPPLVTCYRDNDHDGLGAGTAYKLASCTYGYVTNHADCNDANASVTTGPVFYRDADGDGYGNPSVRINACSQPAGYVTNADDCDDSSATTHPQSCEMDYDFDGYSKPATVCVAACPAPAYWGKYDCNDFNAAVHPESYELPENGVDDNCNGYVDESEFYYSDATLESTNSVTLDFALEQASSAARARNNQPLWVQVRYAPMTNTAAVQMVAGAVTTSLPSTGLHASPRGRFTVWGLEPATAYKMEILLFADAQFQNNIAVGGGAFGAPTTSVSYYVMTTTLSADPVASARPGMFLRAFIELENTRVGLVKGGGPYCPGYNCDVDHGGEEWCSEFYNYVIDPYYRDIVTAWHLYDLDIIHAFVNCGQWSDGIVGLPYLQMGDYLGIGPLGGVHHSAMFVAWDQAQGKAWAINGNVGNRVALSTYGYDLVGGYGVLNTSMLR